MTYRAELSQRALMQLGDLPAKAFDALIEAMARAVEYPDDPMRTFPTSDPYVRRAGFGVAGLVTYVINDARQTAGVVQVGGHHGGSAVLRTAAQPWPSRADEPRWRGRGVNGLILKRILVLQVWRACESR